MTLPRSRHACPANSNSFTRELRRVLPRSLLLLADAANSTPATALRRNRHGSRPQSNTIRDTTGQPASDSHRATASGDVRSRWVPRGRPECRVHDAKPRSECASVCLAYCDIECERSASLAPCVSTSPPATSLTALRLTEPSGKRWL